MQIKQLTELEFKATMEDMTDITEDGDAFVDIWEYVQLLVDQAVVPHFVRDETLVEYVYRNESETYDHVVIPGIEPGLFVVVVVDLENECVYGHYPVEINSEDELD